MRARTDGGFFARRFCRFVLLGVTILALVTACCVTTDAWAFSVGNASITGFGAYVLSSNTGHLNPNDLTYNSAGNGMGPLNGTGNPTFNVMYGLLDLRIWDSFLDNSLSVFIEPRLWGDLTNQVDSRWPAYEAVPADYRGDGYLMRVGGNNFKAEMWNLYASYHSGDFMLRVGKQSIAWGEDIGLRTLDQVDPLDLSEEFFFGWAGEEFDNIRVPEWMIRIDKGLPNSLIPDLAIQLFASPGTWTPTILPAQGSPFNVVPVVLDYREDVSQGEPIGGFQLSGTLGRTEATLNFLTRPTESGVGVVTPPLAGLTGPYSYGLPGYFFGRKGFVRILAEGEHPRFYAAGGSMDTPVDWAGGIFRLETLGYVNSSFTNDTSTRIVQRPMFNTMVGFDRPTYWMTGESALQFTFQYLESDIAGDLSNVYANGVQQPTSIHSVIVFLDQPLFQSVVDVDLLALADTSEAWWLQPSINWQPGDHWRFTFWYNTYGGAENVAGRFGSFWFLDGPAFRVLYGF